MTTETIRDRAETMEKATERLSPLLKSRITQGAFLSSQPRELEKGRYMAKIGLARPQVVWDPERDEGSLSFLRYADVATINLEETSSGVLIEIPSRSDVLNEAETAEDSLLHRVELAILKSTRDRLVEPAIVQNQLNPIREILVMVGEEAPVRRSELSENSRYFPLLEDLQYIEIGAEEIKPGPAMVQMLERANEKPYLGMLGDILANGYRHLTGTLNLNHVNAFVHTAGSYFWPSQTLGEPLEFRLNDFYMSLKKVYSPVSVEKRKVYNRVQAMTEAGIFEETASNRRRAHEDIWARFSEKAPAIS